MSGTSSTSGTSDLGEVFSELNGMLGDCLQVLTRRELTLEDVERVAGVQRHIAELQIYIAESLQARYATPRDTH